MYHFGLNTRQTQGIRQNTMVKHCMLGLIRLYQQWVSPLLPRTCRYYPSCSQYGTEAIEKHGTLKGSLLLLNRLLRCQPFSKGGIDFVP